MISIQQAVETIKNNLTKTAIETVNIADAANRFLAEDITAPESCPRYTNSAMDGFAVCWTDVEKNVSQLQIVGESSAGLPYSKTVTTGKTVRINTGAVLPDGTDTVVPVEDINEQGDNILILEPVKKFQHVRFAGEEIKPGEKILISGKQLTPGAIGFLANFGIHNIRVYQHPKVGIIVTGSELVSVDATIKPWQIRDSNSYMLRAAVHNSNCQIVLNQKCVDSLSGIRRAIQSAAEVADIIILSGGVSVGAHDLVRQAAGETGWQTLFWRVKQKPGKPLFVAKKANKLLFGLPGNPVSALHCFSFYVFPALQFLQGGEFTYCNRHGYLSESIYNTGSRARFVQIKFGDFLNDLPTVQLVKKQRSHMLSSISQADGYFMLEPEKRLEKKDLVNVFLYPWSK